MSEDLLAVSFQAMFNLGKDHFFDLVIQSVDLFITRVDGREQLPSCPSSPPSCRSQYNITAE